MDVKHYHRVRAGMQMPVRTFYFRGFTLTELLVASIVVGILSAVAIPSFAELIDDMRLASSVNLLGGTLHLARSEAIKRGRDVVICKGNRTGGCDHGSEWQQGWIVFVDENRNRQWEEGTEPILWNQQTLESGTTVILRAFPSTAYFTYHASGLAGSNGTFTFCDTRGARAAHALIVSRTGRARVAHIAADGSPLTCGDA